MDITICIMNDDGSIKEISIDEAYKKLESEHVKVYSVGQQYPHPLEYDLTNARSIITDLIERQSMVNRLTHDGFTVEFNSVIDLSGNNVEEDDRLSKLRRLKELRESRRSVAAENRQRQRHQQRINRSSNNRR